jgi:hypothetical protein
MDDFTLNASQAIPTRIHEGIVVLRCIKNGLDPHLTGY